MKIRKGDNVKILTGKDRGKTGKIVKVLPKLGKVVVENLNVTKRHSRPKKMGQKGQIIQKPMPLDLSNVSLICSSCGKPTKVGGKIAGKEKFRVCKKCGANI